MIDILSNVWDAIRSVPFLFADLIMAGFNGIIAAFAAMVTFALELLPSLPDPLTAPSGGVLGWLTWFFPVGALVAGLSTFVTLWITYLAIRVLLRWVKAA